MKITLFDMDLFYPEQFDITPKYFSGLGLNSFQQLLSDQRLAGLYNLLLNKDFGNLGIFFNCHDLIIKALPFFDPIDYNLLKEDLSLKDFTYYRHLDYKVRLWDGQSFSNGLDTVALDDNFVYLIFFLNMLFESMHITKIQKYKHVYLKLKNIVHYFLFQPQYNFDLFNNKLYIELLSNENYNSQRFLYFMKVILAMAAFDNKEDIINFIEQQSVFPVLDREGYIINYFQENNLDYADIINSGPSKFIKYKYAYIFLRKAEKPKFSNKIEYKQIDKNVFLIYYIDDIENYAPDPKSMAKYNCQKVSSEFDIPNIVLHF